MKLESLGIDSGGMDWIRYKYELPC